MKALSLWQPWATLIALREKRIETRGWSTNYRGELAIHAAQRWTADTRATLDEVPFRERLAYHGITPGNVVHDNMPRGAVVAVADLVDVISTERLILEGWLSEHCSVFTPARCEEFFGNYGPGRFGFLLENVRPVYPSVLVRGRQGLFDLSKDEEFRVRENVAAVDALEADR